MGDAEGEDGGGGEGEGDGRDGEDFAAIMSDILPEEIPQNDNGNADDPHDRSATAESKKEE